MDEYLQFLRNKIELAPESGFQVDKSILHPAELPDGLTPEDYMAICFSMIHCADAAAFLPDWAESRGASLEHGYCLYIGKPVWYLRK